MNTETFVATINKIRRDCKNNWYVWSGTVNGHDVQIKGYNTWLQIIRVNGIKHHSGMDIKVSEFKKNLENAIQYHDPA